MLFKILIVGNSSPNIVSFFPLPSLGKSLWCRSASCDCTFFIITYVIYLLYGLSNPTPPLCPSLILYTACCGLSAHLFGMFKFSMRRHLTTPGGCQSPESPRTTRTVRHNVPDENFHKIMTAITAMHPTSKFLPITETDSLTMFDCRLGVLVCTVIEVDSGLTLGFL